MFRVLLKGYFDCRFRVKAIYRCEIDTWYDLSTHITVNTAWPSFDDVLNYGFLRFRRIHRENAYNYTCLFVLAILASYFVLNVNVCVILSIFSQEAYVNNLNKLEENGDVEEQHEVQVKSSETLSFLLIHEGLNPYGWFHTPKKDLGWGRVF